MFHLNVIYSLYLWARAVGPYKHGNVTVFRGNFCQIPRSHAFVEFCVRLTALQACYI
jgi:hypothetical protein